MDFVFGRDKGQAGEYTGEAVNPKNLSWYEIVTGVGRSYRVGSTSESQQIEGSSPSGLA